MLININYSADVQPDEYIVREHTEYFQASVASIYDNF